MLDYADKVMGQQKSIVSHSKEAKRFGWLEQLPHIRQ
jgi:hypothetical protein